MRALPPVLASLVDGDSGFDIHRLLRACGSGEGLYPFQADLLLKSPLETLRTEFRHVGRLLEETERDFDVAVNYSQFSDYGVR